MAKVKPTRRNPVVDMTAMCDVAFLLLTFFILTAKFKPQSVVAVDVPMARATTPVDNAIIITLNKEGKAFISLKEKATRYAMLEKMYEFNGTKYPEMGNVMQNQNQKEYFSLIDTWGTPVEDMSRVLKMNGTEFKEYQEKVMPGIPFDSLHNQLGDWVMSARYATGGDIKIGIKGDKNTQASDVKKIIKALTDKDIHRFILITTLSGGGEGEAAEGGEAKAE